MGEQRSPKPQVAGSNPATPASFSYLFLCLSTGSANRYKTRIDAKPEETLYYLVAR